MRKVWAALIIVLLLSAGFAGYRLLDQPGVVGFKSTDLAVPSTTMVQGINDSLPYPLTAIEPPGQYGSLTLSWQVTGDIYAGYGGVMNLTVTEDGARIFVYGYGIQWTNGPSFFRDSATYINGSGTASLGLLVFGAPAESGAASYSVLLKLASFNVQKGAWHDYGTIDQHKENSVELKPLVTAANYTMTQNPGQYYDMINSLVNFDQVQSVVDEVHQRYPGAYSVLQIAEAYSWMKQNIVYKLEADIDHWPSVNETLNLGTADCKGQSVLMASIVTALGGSTRVNLIDQHAFPTVFVGATASDMAKVKQALASYYGLPVLGFHVAYFVDQYGYWLVIDPNGFPYCGGIPAQSAPTTSNTDAFQISSTFLYEVDVTGNT